MSRLFDYYALLVGRILIGGFFLWSGILLALNLSEATEQFVGVAGSVEPVWLAVAAIALQVVGGIAIIINWKMRYFALGLALYFIAATILVQGALPDASSASYFLKNMALIGALLYVSATSA